MLLAASRALLCREAAPLQRAALLAARHRLAAAGVPVALQGAKSLPGAVAASGPAAAGLQRPAVSFSTAAAQPLRSPQASVSMPAMEALAPGGTAAGSPEFLESLKAAAEAHMPEGTGLVSTLPVLNLNGEEVGSFELPADIFGQEVRRDILQRVVRWQLAKRQQGTHSAKGRSEVRGGGRKPIPQKKTGNARAGSIRSPLWRGGGVIHGPRPRSHAHKLQKKVRRLGMKVALSAKAREGRLIILDSMNVGTGKTKDMAAHLKVLLADAPRESILFCDSGKTAPDGGELLRRSISNMIWVDALPSEGLNVYSILQRDYLAITREAAYKLMARLRRPIYRHGCCLPM
eukprot:jgi/Tetstr1/420432/TSEL_011546.t1